MPPVALTVLAYAAQAFVLFATFVMGLGWGGVTYITADEVETQTFEVVVGDADGCSVSTVDGYLQRRPTTGLEPGSWTVLTSTDDGPASVVIRDSAAAVVLQQRAHPRPEDHDDVLRIEEQSHGFRQLVLDEGDYEIECRHGGGAATTVSLPVAWVGPASDEQEKNVAVRVFRTPDDWK